MESSYAIPRMPNPQGKGLSNTSYNVGTARLLSSLTGIGGGRLGWQASACSSVGGDGLSGSRIIRQAAIVSRLFWDREKKKAPRVVSASA
jgi:hypothetical protein